MLRSLRIENWRRFKHLELDGLGQVTLLVGANNSGKTSALEAIHLFASREDPESVYSSLIRRGEMVLTQNGGIELDARRLFRESGDPQDPIRIQGTHEAGEQTLRVAIRQARGDQERYGASQEIFGRRDLALGWDDGKDLRIPLTPREGLSMSWLEAHTSLRHEEGKASAVFVDSSALRIDEVVSRYEDILLTPEERTVLEAIRVVDPSIERIVSLRAARRPLQGATRGGLVALRKGEDKRLPVGSFGEGVWRMLGLAGALVEARNGVLLVDDIDAGLHYSVMLDMWRLVCESATRLDIQVVATAHSNDCWDGLAEFVAGRKDPLLDVSLQRIEPDRARTVAYTCRQLMIAAERNLEVR